MDKRYRMLFLGTVQGVGFRAAAKALAHQHRVSGTARNMADGRVEVIAEGNEHVLGDFYCDLKHLFHKNITYSEMHESPATGEFAGFYVEC